VREQKQDCVEVDRAEAPGGFDDDDAYSAEEGRGEGRGPEQEHGLHFSSFDQRRFYSYVHTGSYDYGTVCIF
jgi:hypothetical protein